MEIGRDKRVAKTLGRRLRGPRGSVFLEAALVMPLYFIFLCFFADVPRIMGIRQRVTGASRLVSEVRARGLIGQGNVRESVESLFFEADEVEDSKSLPDEGERSVLAGWTINTGSDLADGVLGLVAGFFTGGASGAYWTEIMEAAVYRSGDFRVKIDPVLPTGFYESFAKVEAFTDGNLGIRGESVCYMPNTDSCQSNSTPAAEFVKDIKDMFPDWLVPDDDDDENGG